MPTILDIPEVRQRLSPLTVEEYHRLGEYNEHGRRTELIRGFIVEKISKLPLHRTVSSALYKLLTSRLLKGFSVWKEEPLTLTDSEPEPDVSVTVGEDSDYKTAHPATAELVVEVAVSSPLRDRETASLYAEAGVKEYWIVLCATKQVEVYRQPVDGRYLQKELFGVGATLKPIALPDVDVAVSDLFE
jgi:Uma2 family endonuclease